MHLWLGRFKISNFSKINKNALLFPPLNKMAPFQLEVAMLGLTQKNW